jgi:hypothetical protein
MTHLWAVVWYTAVWTFLVTYQLVFYHLLCVAVDQLPVPTATSNLGYKITFALLQYVAANYTRGTKGAQGKLGGGNVQ